ncbi:cytochrome P450 [Stigmatella hybrida]|uniref:cytochrome P450 n=1 Tax=Stigmatella hybrida TaxID=394097 RepID=UPI001CDA75B6|nr:cytochrome P450 [Stigmatella hybrida]
MRDNVYIEEAVRVLAVKGYRSAIGSYWNAVVDDLRRKIIYRSLDLFNKEMKPKRDVKTYEDFQDLVVDNDLIEGAYKIGVISWEARKMLHHARETRNVFDGHPSSSTPSPMKVLDMMNDCNKYVLSQEYPPAIIDLGTYIAIMDSPGFDRNVVAIDQAVSDLPEVYKNELANRFYSIYTHPDSSTALRSNVEIVAPILWQVLPKETRIQIAKRFDKEIVGGDAFKIQNGMDFLAKVGGMKYVSTASRKAILEPIIKGLEDNLDKWSEEAQFVTRLERFGSSVPVDFMDRFVSALTLTYVGYKGSSYQFARKDFYSNTAAPIIIRMFEGFDDTATRAFVNAVKTNEKLQRRIQHGGQLQRIRNLGNILLNRPSLPDDLKQFIELLVAEGKTNEFFFLINGASSKAT